MISTYQSILTFSIAAIALLASPGPATLALAASGAAYGMRKSLKFYAGVISGLTIAVFVVATGLYVIIKNFEFLGIILMGISIIYMIYLAYGIATASPIRDEQATPSPGLGAGFTLGITNVKAYVAFAALLGSFTLDIAPSWEQGIKALICILVCIGSDFCWLLAGSKLRVLFVHPVWSRVLNISFATLMIATVAWSLTRLE